MHQRRPSLKLGAPAGMIMNSCIHGVGRVCAAVQNVHHGHRQLIAGHAAQETVQGHPERWRLRGPRRWRRPGWRLRRGWTYPWCRQLQHSGIDGVDVRGVHADKGLVDGGVDVLHGLADALAAETALIAVAQFQGLKFAGGSAAGGSTAADGAVRQPNFGLNSGVAAGVDDPRPMTFSISR